MAIINSFHLPSYDQVRHLFGRGMRLSWVIVFVGVIAIVVSNYIHERNSAPVEDDHGSICDGVPMSRKKEGEGHLCTLLDKNLVEKRRSSKRSMLEIFCRRGQTPFWHLYFSTGLLDVRCETDDYEILSGSNATEVSKEFDKMWGIKLINYPAYFKSRFRLSPFNDTCKGVVHRDNCWIGYTYHSVDVSLITIFLFGLFLFLSAENLSKSTMLYYGSGVGLGIFASLIIVMLVFSRFMYKRGGFVAAMVFGWSGVLYCFSQLYANLATILETYQAYILGYTSVMATSSFYFCYYLGPPSSPRTLDLIRWTVQATGIIAMLFASHAPLFHRVTVVFVLLSLYFFPLRSIVKTVKGNHLLYRMFPPKIKLLTEEEYFHQGSIETKKALEKLRDYCKSPDCNAWKTISRVKTPQRLAAFVEGDSHLSDFEVLEYESDPQPQLTDDEDLSDDDLQFELN